MDAGKTGAYLAALRKARGMTQQEAADQPCKLSFQAVAVFPSIFKSIGIRIQNG